MNKSWFFPLAALALGLLFLLQFGAELIVAFSPPPSSGRVPGALAFSMKLFPPSGKYAGETGFTLVDQGTRENDVSAVKAGMPYLRMALKKNPLDYQSRYYLAKAYLRLSSVGNDYFERGLLELQRAARLRGSNKQIALDCVRVYFSLWPLLEKQDQDFAAELLASVMPAIGWNEFAPLLEMWADYVQDVELLMDILRRKPGFFGPAANHLVAAGLPIELRHELLDLYETYTLDAVQRRYNELSFSGVVAFENARQMLEQLRAIKGYHRLRPKSGFSEDDYYKLQRFLLRQAISGLLADPAVHGEPAAAVGTLNPKQRQLREYITTYIAEHAGNNELDELQKLLEDYRFFKENDFPSLRVKTAIAFRKGDYSGVIAEIDSLRHSISFVKKEQEEDYAAILLMLVDSFYGTKLMTAAESVAADLVRNRPDDADVHWRVLRVRKVLGSEGPADSELDEKLARVENSRFLTITRLNSEHAVFLFNVPEIEIAFDPGLAAQAGNGRILQVFVEGRIAFECYSDAIPPKIVVGPPFSGVERKVRVRVQFA